MLGARGLREGAGEEWEGGRQLRLKIQLLHPGDSEGKPADAGDGACGGEPAAAGFKELLANHPSRGPERGWKLNAHLALGSCRLCRVLGDNAGSLWIPGDASFVLERPQ